VHRNNCLRIAGSLAVSSILLAAAACGGQSLSSDTKGSSAGATSATLDKAPAEDKAADIINTITPDKDLTAKVPATIKSAGLKMTTSEGYPPMEMFASDNKTIVGLDPSLGRAIARKLGVKITISNEDFNAQIPGIVTGRYDIIMSSMTDNATRQAKVTFVDAFRAGAGFLVKKGNPDGITGPASMCGKTVSVVDNGSSLKLAQQYDADCKNGGKPAINILKFTGDQDALLQVGNGRAQANITDYVVAAYKAADPKLNLDAVALDGTESPWGIALNPNNKELIEAVKEALDSLIKGGQYDKILSAWNLDKLTVQSAVINGGK
jgi:polar amino acid transport system substrate-binding protein